MDSKTVLAQIDTLLAEFEHARAVAEHDDLSGGLPDHELKAIRLRCMSAISRLSPPDSPFAVAARDVDGWDGFAVVELAGILGGLRADIEAGFTQDFAELVHADIFEDFLAMAEELIGKGYEAAAAVLTGSVLEEHVRKLADKTGVATTKQNGKGVSFETLTVELVKEKAISEPERKILVGWYGQRTEAAHGRPENLVSDQVAAMPNGIREFVIRHPA